MTQKNLIGTILLSLLIVPTISFAEVPPNKVSPQASVNEEALSSKDLKEQIDKNRKERIDHALSALAQNATNVENAVSQSLIRANGVDKTTKGIDQAISGLQKAKLNLADIKAKITSTREEIKSIDTTNKDQIKAMSEKILAIKKEIRDTINLVLVSIKPVKTMPLVKSNNTDEIKVIQKAIPTPAKKI